MCSSRGCVEATALGASCFYSGTPKQHHKRLDGSEALCGRVQARAAHAQKKKMMCGRSRSLSHRKAASLCTSRSRSRPPFYNNMTFRASFHVVSIALVNGSDESATNNGYYYPTRAGLGTLYNVQCLVLFRNRSRHSSYI